MAVSRFPLWYIALHHRSDPVHGIHHTGKLGQNVITRRVHHPASVLLNELGHHRTVGGYGANGSLLILSHKTAVTLDIGSKDSGELALKIFCNHRGVLVFRLVCLYDREQNVDICQK